MEKYVVNESFQEMQLGDGEGTVFYDPESENTHILDDVALDIIDLFRNSMTVEDVIEELAKLYGESQQKIETDVKEFVEMAVKCKILVSI